MRFVENFVGIESLPHAPRPVYGQRCHDQRTSLGHCPRDSRACNTADALGVDGCCNSDVLAVVTIRQRVKGACTRGDFLPMMHIGVSSVRSDIIRPLGV